MTLSKFIFLIPFLISNRSIPYQTIECEADLTNVSELRFEKRSASMLLEHVEELKGRGITAEKALRFARRIQWAMETSAQLVRKGKLDLAILVLNDSALLDGDVFKLRLSSRVVVDPEMINESNEADFSTVWIEQQKTAFRVNSDGRIVLPVPPKIGSSEKSLWSQRAWIRIAAEDLGHAAQYYRAAGGQLSLLSQRLRNPKLLAKVNWGLRHLRERFPDMEHGDVLEADIYARMIELYGTEFMPNWVGVASGYYVRQLVDYDIDGSEDGPRSWKPLGAAE